MFIQRLFESIVAAPGKFVEVASHGPISALLILAALVILAVSIGFFGVLVLGAVVDLVSPSPGGQPRRPGR